MMGKAAPKKIQWPKEIPPLKVSKIKLTNLYTQHRLYEEATTRRKNIRRAICLKYGITFNHNNWVNDAS